MKKVIVVLIGIIRRGNKYLLTKRIHEEKRYHDKWQLPGGELEFGETMSECLKRELREEIGMEATPIKLLPKILTRTDGKMHFILISYLCKLDNPDTVIQLNDEASEYGWYTYKEMQKLEQLPQLSDIIREAEGEI